MPRLTGNLAARRARTGRVNRIFLPAVQHFIQLLEGPFTINARESERGLSTPSLHAFARFCFGLNRPYFGFGAKRAAMPAAIAAKKERRFRFIGKV